MSSIGVVVLRNSALGNAQILQESVDNASNINNNDKPKREIIIVRKKQKIQPQQTVSVTSLVLAAESNTPLPTPPVAPAPARAKRPRVRDDTPDEVRAPAPLAVARRNARERNRVRQVNNGFAALRRHIPEEVAEAFETANSSRGPNKKLSKVETLRMAVEYIRNLESLLNIGPAADKENTSRTGAESFPSPASSSPRDASFEQSYFSLNSPALDDDEDEMDGPLPTLTRHQYARIPDTFHPGSIHLYEEDENRHPATPASDLIVHDDLLSPQLLDASFQFINSAEHFTVIHPDNFSSEADFDEVASEMDIKYSETLRLADVDADTLGDESVLGDLSTIDPQLVLPQPQYRLLDEDISAAAMMEESCGLELKRELPDTHVSPEDRQQFEETLKWWQEKTRSGRPVLVSRDRAD